MRSPSFSRREMVHSMNTSIPSCTACCWSVRIISRPVRSPTGGRRAEGGAAAALRHHRMRLAEQRLADEGGARPLGGGLNGGTQPGASRPDDDHVELVRFVLTHR